MKKIALLILCSIGVIMMSSCGNSNENKQAEEVAKKMDLPKEGVHGSENAGDGLQNVTDGNYVGIAKDLFGLNVAAQDGWTLKSAKSPNKVNNLNVVYEMADADAEIETVAKAYFDQCLAVAADGVSSMKMDYNTGALNVGDKFADYASYRAQSDGSHMWTYDYNGKSIQFTISAWKKQLEISMVLISK